MTRIKDSDDQTHTRTGCWLKYPNLNAGAVGTEVQNFVCVYYYQEYMECTWESAKNLASSQQRLWYW